MSVLCHCVVVFHCVVVLSLCLVVFCSVVVCHDTGPFGGSVCERSVPGTTSLPAFAPLTTVLCVFGNPL